MSDLNVVVIGGVACGPKAAARVKRCNPQAQVTLIEKGHDISYGGCGLPYFVGSTVKELKDLMTTSWEAVRTPEFMKETKDIDTLLGWEATKIDREAKTVEVKDLHSDEVKVLPYDKLVLATGSDNFKPPIGNIDAKGVFGMKTPDDALAMQSYIKEHGVEKAVVIGAGLIGMECAEAYSDWGVDVTVIEMQSWVFPQMLDKEMAAVFQNYLESEDMHFMLDTKVEAFEVDEKGKVCAVVTDKGTVEAQMVLVAAGVRPVVKLAQDCGLEVGRAIIVNEYCQTSDPDIYAGGDCVMVKNIVSGELMYAPMGSTANKHGRIIGTNIAKGNIETMPGVVGTSIVKMLDWSAGKVGLGERDCKRLGIEYAS